ncbi:hypothetical protein [Modestobacter sp. KNN46-3]|uniref:hypothetical protein n=1 Tax=Modestobacter sp. KNN46-3 TaxID=2711218 RepID=UPI0013DF4880|nr:hypothetical protein [Modestobacter sp. KNN46-3]
MAAPGSWGALEVRSWLEETFRDDGATWDVQLVGTLLHGERVVVIVSSARDGQVHRITSDLAELREAISPATWGLITGEVFRSLHPWTLTLQGVDAAGISDWR